MNKEHLHKIITQNPTHNFLTDSRNGETYTYESFFQIAHNASVFLRKNNITKVALVVENSVELLALYIGALLEGVVMIPIDPTKGKPDIEEILEEGKCEVIICNSKIFKEKIEGKTIFHIEEIKSYFYENNTTFNPQRILQIDGKKCYSITFTSGTSGKPKGVMHSFNNLYGAGRDFAEAMTFNSSHIFYHNLPMTYMAGLLNLFFVPLGAGARIVIGNRFSIFEVMKFWKPIIKYEVNAFFLIPTMVSLLMKVDKGTKGIDYCKTKNILAGIGTAALDQNLRQQFTEKYGFHLYESYGSSEALFTSTNSPQNDRIQGVGKPVPNVECHFADDGEIQIKSPHNMLGYYNIDTAKFIENNRYKTGDLGYLADGFLTINGRKKDLIIRGGVNISPAKIERSIQATKLTGECVIAGLPDPITGEKTVCFYLENQPIEKDTQKQINQHLTTQLGKDYVVDEFSPIKEFPRNANGKIDKKKLVTTTLAVESKN